MLLITAAFPLRFLPKIYASLLDVLINVEGDDHETLNQNKHYQMIMYTPVLTATAICSGIRKKKKQVFPEL